MAAKKKGSVSSKTLGKPSPEEGAARSPETVTAPNPEVKAIRDTTSPELTPRQRAALRAAETRRREAGYRAKVKAARAREQRAAALLERRRVVADGEARRLEIIAGADLTAAEAQAEKERREKIAAADIGTALATLSTAVSGQTKKELVVAKNILEGKKILAELARRPVKPSELEEIKIGREYLEVRVKEFYEKAKAKGEIKPLSGRHEQGKTWTHRSKLKSGAVVDRYSGQFLQEGTLETFVHRMVRAAARAQMLEPGGKLYVSLSMVEYGKHVPRSPGPVLYEDALGQMRQGFEGTGRLAPASDIPTFELQVRMMLEERLRGAGSTNAIMIDSFEVKSFRDNTLEEQAAFESKMRKGTRKKRPSRKKRRLIELKRRQAEIDSEIKKLRGK